MSYVRSFLPRAATIVFGLSVGWITPAGAVTYDLTEVSQGYNAGVGPFGTVDVTLSGTTLHFDVNVSPNYMVHTGTANKPSFAFRLSNTAGTFANIVPDASTESAGFTHFQGGTYSNGSFGGFNYGLNCELQGGGTGCGSSLSFDILNAGTLLTGINNVTSSIIYFVVDIFSSTTRKTGAVAATLHINNTPPP